ncbi:hypothetical protein ES708_19507 [subsurface metagenome]
MQIKIEKNKEDCKHWGEVKYKYLTTPGCELKYRYWCKFGCMNCKDYEKKGKQIKKQAIKILKESKEHK